jgi:hypothetical protein
LDSGRNLFANGVARCPFVMHLVPVAALHHKVRYRTIVARSGYGVGAVPVAVIAKGLSLTDFSAANTRRDDKQTEFCSILGIFSLTASRPRERIV